MKDGAKVRLFAGICKLLSDYLTISCCPLVFGASGRKADDNILCIQSAVIQAFFLYDWFIHNYINGDSNLNNRTFQLFIDVALWIG